MSSFSQKNLRQNSGSTDRSVSNSYPGYVTVESISLRHVTNDPLDNWVSLGILIVAIISGYSAYNLLNEPESVLRRSPEGSSVSVKNRRDVKNTLIPDSSLERPILLNTQREQEDPLLKSHK